MHAAEDIDPNRHLQGAYSFASCEVALTGGGSDGLFAAGFWNYLREDITFSLFEVRPLKINLRSFDVPTMLARQGPLNSISIILGKVINAAFMQDMCDNEWKTLAGMAHLWLNGLSDAQRAYSRLNFPKALPKVWFLQEAHGRSMTCMAVAKTIRSSTTTNPIVSFCDALFPDCF
ncbi:hypothetical protein QQS21_012126 [Conoideocrella luteorostrata]|uniref:Uncharacterized protein n=1 Tax=Conoideocrella luteorostrata TaxID=1105319 RepID=A0AAJ0CEI9_9HYPO|nr:hypothetical protein QQS21_012126 [Conoideocrella luteorostrata]